MVIGNIERLISHLMADVVAGGRKAFVVTNGLPKDVFIERLAMRCAHVNAWRYDRNLVPRRELAELSARVLVCWSELKDRVTVSEEMAPCPADCRLYVLERDLQQTVDLYGELAEGSQSAEDAVAAFNRIFGLREFHGRTMDFGWLVRTEPLEKFVEKPVLLKAVLTADYAKRYSPGAVKSELELDPDRCERLDKWAARTGCGFASLFKEYLSYRFGERRQRFCLMAKEGGEAFVSRKPEAEAFLLRVLNEKDPEFGPLKPWLCRFVLAEGLVERDWFFPEGVEQRRVTFVRRDDMLFEVPESDYVNWLFNCVRTTTPDTDLRLFEKNIRSLRTWLGCSLDAVTDRHGHDALWYLLASNLDRSPDDLAPYRRVLESAGCTAALDRYDLAFDEILDPSILEWTFDTRNSFDVDPAPDSGNDGKNV